MVKEILGYGLDLYVGGNNKYWECLQILGGK
jgi:hypothetical protein